MLEPYLKPLLLTILFELFGAYVLGIRKKKDFILVVLSNILTNPLLVYISLFLMYHLDVARGQIITYAVLEPLVVYAEYLLYRNYLLSDKNPFCLSLYLNLISILGGILCRIL